MRRSLSFQHPCGIRRSSSLPQSRVDLPDTIKVAIARDGNPPRFLSPLRVISAAVIVLIHRRQAVREREERKDRDET